MPTWGGKKWKTIRLEEKTYKKLIKFRGDYTGRYIRSMSALVELLLDLAKLGIKNGRK